VYPAPFARTEVWTPPTGRVETLIELAGVGFGAVEEVLG
jgi:hypothetical protein